METKIQKISWFFVSLTQVGLGGFGVKSENTIHSSKNMIELCEAYEVGFDFVFPPEQSQ